MQNCHIWRDTIKGTTTTKNKHEITPKEEGRRDSKVKRYSLKWSAETELLIQHYIEGSANFLAWVRWSHSLSVTKQVEGVALARKVGAKGRQLATSALNNLSSFF